MEITVRELMTKIKDIQHVIDELDKMPVCDACIGGFTIPQRVYRHAERY